jgi:hypothetical protein
VGMEFSGGSFIDIGTPEGMRRCLAGTRPAALAG